MIHYRQCKFKKYFGDPATSKGGYTFYTSWIPEQFAKIGNYVKFKDDNGNWDDGWLTEEVGRREPEDHILEHERDYTTLHRAQPLQRGNK